MFASSIYLLKKNSPMKLNAYVQIQIQMTYDVTRIANFVESYNFAVHTNK